MLKKSLIAIAVLALAMPAMAGSLKVHSWEVVYKAQDICTIDVLIDIGYYIVIDNQKPVKLDQIDSTTNYEGTYTSNVHSNFAAKLSAKTTKLVSMNKLEATFVQGATIPAGDSVIEIKIKATDVAIEDLAACTTNQKIGEVTISVAPDGAASVGC
jgi:hypothetical protein